MGRNHLRAAAASGFKIAGIFDLDSERARAASAEFGFPVLENFGDLEAAIVAVPTAGHTSSALPLLQKGIHCLVEKPFAATEAECRRMIDAAAIAGAVLQIGHIERFNPAVTALMDAAPAHITHMAARRAGTASARVMDISVVSDLMVHDLDVVLALKKMAVTEVKATGNRDDATAALTFADGSTAVVSASRVATARVRELQVTTPDKRYDLDYIAKSLGRDGQTPMVYTGDALSAQMTDFVTSIEKKRLPRVTGETALSVMKLCWRIEAALNGPAP